MSLKEEGQEVESAGSGDWMVEGTQGQMSVEAPGVFSRNNLSFVLVTPSLALPQRLIHLAAGQSDASVVFSPDVSPSYIFIARLYSSEEDCSK